MRRGGNRRVYTVADAKRDEPKVRLLPLASDILTIPFVGIGLFGMVFVFAGAMHMLFGWPVFE